MGESDRLRWDAAYGERRGAPPVGLPAVFAPAQDMFPRSGSALELACGTGAAAVWLALRGLDVTGVDVSAVAIERARQSARRHGVAQRCRWHGGDLDDGLPAGDPADVVLCHRFRDPRLYPAIRDRLAAGGLLAICVLSEVGAAPGRFRAVAGELSAAFADLEPIAQGEGDGQAWLVARAPTAGG